MGIQTSDAKQDDDDEMAVDAMLVSAVYLAIKVLFFLGFLIKSG